MLHRKLPIMGSTWVGLWSIAMSLSWVVPNHFPPWVAFHSDVWVATMLWLGSGAVIWNIRRYVEWDIWVLVILCIGSIPWMQWMAGLIPFMGQAWVSSLYIFGFGLALQVGRQWEQVFPGQLLRALLAAVGFAAIVSVGLQLYTWLDLQGADLTDIGSMGQTGSRPYANLGQPNLLATLLIWAVLATLWAYHERILSKGSAVFVVLYLMVGLALTQSRTGQLALIILLISIWYWKDLWRSRQLPWVATFLFGLFWLFPVILACLHSLLFLGDSVEYSRGMQSGMIRLKIWRLLLSAVWEHPWAGYGWTEITRAQVEVANQFPSVGEMFGQSHNLFLEFFLWTGLPLGLILTATLGYAAKSLYRGAKSITPIIILLCIMVVGIHAMLELPLHYAFFLLPVGLMIGVLRAKDNSSIVLCAPVWTLYLLWLVAGSCLAVTVSDYLRVEESYNALRMEKARIGLAKTGVGKPPEVFVLTQLRDWIWAQRQEVRAGMSEEDIGTIDALTARYPTPIGMYNMAKIDALNQKTPRAQYWLDRLCRFSTPQQCELLNRKWTDESKQFRSMAEVVFPKGVESPLD